jgi:hypothetical protein
MYQALYRQWLDFQQEKIFISSPKQQTLRYAYGSDVCSGCGFQFYLELCWLSKLGELGGPDMLTVSDNQ